jgi:hypothetical protein
MLITMRRIKKFAIFYLSKRKPAKINAIPPRLRAPLGTRRAECGFPYLIRHGGVPSGAATLLIRGVWGGDSPRDITQTSPLPCSKGGLPPMFQYQNV